LSLFGRIATLEHDEIETLFRTLPRDGILAVRNRALFMVLYNTGARAQEVADLKVEDVDLDGPLRVRLHGKGDKWRSCPLWPETAELLKRLTADVRGNQCHTPRYSALLYWVRYLPTSKRGDDAAGAAEKRVGAMNDVDA
jgi:integrase